MNARKIAGGAAALAVLLGALPVQAQGDPAAGKGKSHTCAGCHGIRDYRNAYPELYSVPRLGGQVEGYVEKSLKDFRAGTRKHAVMQSVAAILNDQDIADLAAYYAPPSARIAAASTTPVALRKKAEDSCAACHGKAGEKPTLPDAPLLAGQESDYLVHALKAFRSGARDNPLMGAIAKPLSDADIDALSTYYASLPGLYTKR